MVRETDRYEYVLEVYRRFDGVYTITERNGAGRLRITQLKSDGTPLKEIYID